MSYTQPYHCVEPGSVKSTEKSRADDVPRYPYRIVNVGVSLKKEPPNTHERAWLDKKIKLTTALDHKRVRHELRTAYACLEEGSRVEFHLRTRHICVQTSFKVRA